MKKAISILLVVSIAASLCMTAFASVITITRYCETCKKDTLHYEYTDVFVDDTAECPTHEKCTAIETHTRITYECFKCCETEVTHTYTYSCPND